MDSISNLPLLEIAAEDDSLLSAAPPAARIDAAAATSSPSASTVFSCSPLLSLRSISRTALDSENASSATKLNVEAQPMKRKKKGGGYNLRKSLAWDRAFLTEEGVLNPLELSMISGIATPKRTNTVLKSIQEEEPASASLALREIEENLFRQSSDGGACIEDSRNIGAYELSPKSAASTKGRTPNSLAKRKMLAVNDVVGNRSKRNACPRPVASSSLKRPDTAKTPSKESKVTKIPAPKSNVSGIGTTRRGTLTTGFPKENQNAHLATSVHKYAGAKGLSKNLRTAPSNAKVDRAKKCSFTRTLNNQAGKRLDNSVPEAPMPSGLHRPGAGASKVVEARLPQGVSKAGEKKQQGQSQTTKPSGLRMPSPSLGFFSQAKASGSHSQLQKSSKPCKPPETNIPKLRKLEVHSVNEARLPPAPRKGPEIVEGVANICTKKLSLSDVKSEPGYQVENNQIAGLEVESDSLDIEETGKHEIGDIKKMAGIAVKCDSLDLESISRQEIFENIIVHVDIKSKESSMEDTEFPINEKKRLSKGHTHEQPEKKADHPFEDKTCDVLSKENQSADQETLCVCRQSMHRTSIDKGNISNTVHNGMGRDEEQTMLLTSNVLTSNESSVLQEKDGDSSKDNNRDSEEFKKNGRGQDEEQTKLLASDVLTSNESSVLQEKDRGSSKDNSRDSEVVKSDCESRGNDMLTDVYSTISEWQFIDDCSSMDTSLSCDEQQANTLSEEQLRDDGSSMDTSLHFDVCREVPGGNFDKQDDVSLHSETNEVICADEGLVANHGHLLGESEFSKKTVDFISNTEDSNCDGSEDPFCLLQHAVLAPSVRDFDRTNGESGESHVEDEQVQPLVDNPVAYSCDNEHCLSVTNDRFLSMGDNDINKESHLSELQRPSVVDANSQQVDNILHLDGDGLPESTAYTEEIKEQTSSEGALEGCNASNNHTQVMPEYIDGNLDVDKWAECLQMDDVKKDSTDIFPAVEVQFNHEVIPTEFGSSIKISDDITAEVVNCKSDAQCSSSENSMLLPASDNLPFHPRISQGGEVSPLNDKQNSQEAETNNFEKDELPNTEIQHQTKGDLCDSEDNSKVTDLEKSATESKPGVPLVKLPPNVVPFSDEWLAAIEAAGEEILTKKGGAVQNSPPEKPQQEPGPWSPVKRKNQAIGPFDCTKHTNIPHSDS